VVAAGCAASHFFWVWWNFHFAAGLRVIGPGVVELHSKDTEFDLQSDPAVAALFGGEDRPIELLTDVKLLRLA
jgi:hypothetical protein